ncbi:hypothetical protein HGO38_23980 [Rhizobium sp. CG5]|uniref:hypothetical protein n=1 Tax=Rhizobium sp. CG5 TaxID=2726076 RepID=UPI002033E632|nr:hypothetical protein [Rhizobium sp. CG5]MCM2476509.1 hypothetical protein [Rhizobium sp. CG5]
MIKPFEIVVSLVATVFLFGSIDRETFAKNFSSYVPGFAIRHPLLVGCVIFLFVAVYAFFTIRWKRVEISQRMPTSMTKNENTPAGSRNITTINQSGGVNHTGDIHVYAEDKSLKQRVRSLFDSVDDRINYLIDTGHTTIRTRMADRHFNKLETLLNESGASDLFVSVDRGGSIYHSLINNGSLGPTGAEEHQIDVSMVTTSALKK